MLIRLRDRLRNEDGNILIVVVLVSMVVGALASLTLTTGRIADQASAKDRNSEIALAVTEAGVHEAIAKIEGRVQAGEYAGSFTIPETTAPHGKYRVEVTRLRQSFEIESWGTTGGGQFERARHLKVTLAPPDLFPDGQYALFSFTSIELKNRDKVYAGDVWANDSITADQGVEITGSVTSAQSWIDFKGNKVGKSIWSGGRNSNGWAMRLSGTIEQWAKASMSSPGCSGDPGNYNIELTGLVKGDATLPDGAQVSGGGTVSPGAIIHDCTAAAAAKPLPVFTFVESNYNDLSDPNDYVSFSGASALTDFQNWLTTDNTREGVVVIDVDNPSQNSRVDLSSLRITGDTMIITNAPVFAHQGPLEDASLTEAIFAVVSHYTAPADTTCDYNQDTSECAIHFKNQFDTTCKTATLLYADNGPVAIKNDNAQNSPDNNTMCGSVVSEAITMKNNQSIRYDPRVANLLGFGSPTFEVFRWEELAAP